MYGYSNGIRTSLGHKKSRVAYATQAFQTVLKKHSLIIFNIPKVEHLNHKVISKTLIQI